MYAAKRYIYVIFMCHLAAEKLLKAIVAQKTNRVPPKTHDLFLLVKLSGVEIPDIHKGILAHLNEASIPTRYPEDVTKMVRAYKKQVAAEYLKKTKGLLLWLKARLK